MKSQRRKQSRVTHRSTAAEREKLMEEFKASGLGRREFAERKGINPLTFSSWFRRTRKRHKQASKEAEFIRVSLPASVSGEVEIEADISTGLRLRIKGLSLCEAAGFVREVSSC